MANLTITIPDDKVQEVLDAFDTMVEGRSTDTKVQWVKRDLINRIKNVVNRYRIEEARKNVDNSDIDIT